MVTDELDPPPANETRNKRPGRKPPAAQSGGAVYGLGLIGALIWYWRQAEDPGDYVTGVLKSLVWPAFLVYHAFEVLHGMNPPGGNSND